MITQTSLSNTVSAGSELDHKSAFDLDQAKVQLAAALRDLGVSDLTLTAEEKASLDRDGYVVIEGVLSAQQAAALARRLDELAAAEGETAGQDFATEPGVTRLGTLVNKDPGFDVCILHPKALAAVSHVMEGDFGLSSITGRAAKPGEGHQGLHRDDPAGHLSANALWILSDFTEENGPTRLIPGSHLWSDAQTPSDLLAAHPEQIHLIAPAGTLVVINGNTWHGGTKNNSQENRHLVSAFFMPRTSGYQDFASRKLTASSSERLSPLAKVVLDFEGIE